MKNLWKYIALISVVNLIILLFYFIGMMVICGVNEVVPLWASQWFGISLFLILFSVFIAAIGNMKEIIKGVIEFLKE